MFKCFLGIGILGLSQGFEKAGCILSPFILAFVYGTSYYTTTLINGKFSFMINIFYMSKHFVY